MLQEIDSSSLPLCRTHQTTVQHDEHDALFCNSGNTNLSKTVLVFQHKSFAPVLCITTSSQIATILLL